VSSALDSPVHEFSLQWQANPPSLVAPSFLTGLQSTSNPVKVVLRVPTREHLVGQLTFPVVTHTTLLVAITEVSISVVWQWTLVVTQRLTIRYLGIASR
jgi:hypothetical protein